MHRVCKACLEGREIVKAVQFEVDPEPNYVDVVMATLPDTLAKWNVAYKYCRDKGDRYEVIVIFC